MSSNPGRPDRGFLGDMTWMSVCHFPSWVPIQLVLSRRWNHRIGERAQILVRKGLYLSLAMCECEITQQVCRPETFFFLIDRRLYGVNKEAVTAVPFSASSPLGKRLFKSGPRPMGSMWGCPTSIPGWTVVTGSRW